MGNHLYSSVSRSVRADSLGYATKSKTELFTSTTLKSEMSPFNVKLREARDSDNHPNSLAIVLGLDETGSMGRIPHYLVQEGLPHIVTTMMDAGVPDPAIMFLGIGDHFNDSSPLQVSQFESGDELLDEWLTKIFLEGRGGGNDGESYMLAWYFAAFYTSIDCFEKRNKKGFIFTIGDEPVHPNVSEKFLKKTMGDGEFKDYDSSELYEEASKKYDVFHIHTTETRTGQYPETVNGWKEMIGNNLLIADDKTEIPNIIANTIINREVVGTTEKPTTSKEEIML